MLIPEKSIKMKTILIIGAGGFIGGFIAREALNRGLDVWVGVRETTSRRYLSDSRLHFLTFDYDDDDAVKKTLEEGKPDSGKWDYIIWNLGATKCVNFLDFNRINFGYVRTFTDVLTDMALLPEKFLYMSSLSALGPGDEKNFTPLNSDTVPRPNTRYGLSKIKAETHLETHPEVPWIIFRPTGVYGPHEQDYLMMIKMIDRHFDVGMGFGKQLLTFIYVEDLVNAMFDALERAPVHRKYIISEPRSYSQKEFREIVARHLGVKWVLPVRLPMWVVYCASVIAEKLAAWQLKASTLNRDKYRIMAQRNWSCDISDAVRDFGFSPQFTLERGVEATVKAYLEEKNGRK